MEILKDKKIYFSSDNHLGLDSLIESHDREKIFVKWLDSIKHDAEIIFLLGDLFDFWFEYKEAVPKGFTRSLGKLAELSDMGIKIYFFVGNHDYWMTDYFQKELNIKVFKSPELFIFNSKSFFTILVPLISARKYISFISLEPLEDSYNILLAPSCFCMIFIISDLKPVYIFSRFALCIFISYENILSIVLPN